MVIEQRKREIQRKSDTRDRGQSDDDILLIERKRWRYKETDRQTQIQGKEVQDRDSAIRTDRSDIQRETEKGRQGQIDRQ